MTNTNFEEMTDNQLQREATVMQLRRMELENAQMEIALEANRMELQKYAIAEEVVITAPKTQEVQDKQRKATRAEEAWRESVDQKLTLVLGTNARHFTDSSVVEHVVDAEVNIKVLQKELADALARIEELEDRQSHDDYKAAISTAI